MERFDVKNLDLFDTPKWILQRQYGSMQNAARILNMDYYKLSRIVNGAPHDLVDHLNILKHCKLIPDDYILPRMDFATFLLVNKETINKKTLYELDKYHPRKAPPQKDNINYPHKQGELFQAVSKPGFLTKGGDKQWQKERDEVIFRAGKVAKKRKN